MNNYKSKNRGGFKKGGSKSSFEGKKSFGGDKKHGAARKYGGNKGQGDRNTGSSSELFSATCSECGKRCEVPFRPSQDKPVYCSDCFGAKKNANEPRGSVSERPDYTKLPREERPARHGKNRGRGDDGIVDLKRQISALDLKLNRILDLINPAMPSTKVPLPVKEKDVEKKGAKKVKKASVKKAATKKVAKKAVVKKVTTKKVAKKAVKKTVKKTVAKKVTKKVAKKTKK